MEKKPEIHPKQALAEKVKAFANDLGFDPVGITSADPTEDAEKHLNQWIQAGRAASMHYMAQQTPRRTHPRDLLPEARSLICLAFPYHPGPDPSRQREGSQGRIARYAVGVDYHRVLKKKLRQLENYLIELGGPDTLTRSCVDSAPLLEREFARRAGLGFIGRNTNLITPKHGSWVFLAEVLTNLELATDRPIRVSCGTCTACLEACPTGALAEPYCLDSSRCISYWTIEHRGKIPESIQRILDDWIFGCDICQDICPFNHRSAITGEEQFRQGKIVETTTPLDLFLQLESEEHFHRQLKNSPLLRPKREGILRNALIAAKNTQAKDTLPLVRKLAEQDSNELVRALANDIAQTLESN